MFTQSHQNVGKTYQNAQNYCVLFVLDRICPILDCLPQGVESWDLIRWCLDMSCMIHFEIHNCWRGRLKSTPYVELLECVVGRVVSRTLKIFFSKWSCQCVELKISQWDVSMHMSSMFLSGMELYINFSSILRQNSASAFGYFVPSILFFSKIWSVVFSDISPQKNGESPSPTRPSHRPKRPKRPQVDLFTRHRALTNSKGFASFEDPEGEEPWKFLPMTDPIRSHKIFFKSCFFQISRKKAARWYIMNQLAILWWYYISLIYCQWFYITYPRFWDIYLD